jgi:hypothetical protein
MSEVEELLYRLECAKRELELSMNLTELEERKPQFRYMIVGIMQAIDYIRSNESYE